MINAVEPYSRGCLWCTTLNRYIANTRSGLEFELLPF